MKSKTNIFVAYALVSLFTIFNIGLPIVLFVCPMVSGGQVCTCNDGRNDGLTLSYPMGGCCNHSVAAERNTTPFLGSVKYQSPVSDVVLVLSTSALPAGNSASLSHAAHVSNVGPPHGDAPIYLLSASLLI